MGGKRREKEGEWKRRRKVRKGEGREGERPGRRYFVVEPPLGSMSNVHDVNTAQHAMRLCIRRRRVTRQNEMDALLGSSLVIKRTILSHNLRTLCNYSECNDAAGDETTADMTPLVCRRRTETQVSK